MRIQILGTGCPKCITLEKNAESAVKKLGIDATIEKITDVDKILDMGVMITPALAIDGIVKSAGKVLNVEEIEKIIKKEKIEIAIITAPSSSLSEIINILKKTNIKGILNFAGKHILNEGKIMIRNVDLALELEQLTFLISNRNKIQPEEKGGKNQDNL